MKTNRKSKALAWLAILAALPVASWGQSVSELTELGNRSAIELRWADARGHFDAALRAAPDHLDALVGRAGVWLATKQYEAAFDDLTRALKGAPKHERALEKRLVAAFELGRWKIVLQDVEALKATNSKMLRSDENLVLARAWVGEGDDEKALGLLAAEISRDSKSARTYFEHASILLRRGDVDGALVSFREAERVRRQFKPFSRFDQLAFDDIYLARAKALLGAGREEEAVEALLSLENLGAALDQIEQWVARDRSSAMARGLRGLAKANLGRLDGAVSDLLAAVRLDAGNPDWNFQVAGIYEQLARKGPLHLHTGQGYYKLDRLGYSEDGGQKALDLALAELDACLAADPKLAEGHYYRGLTLVAQGQFGRASGDFSRAIQLNPAELRYYAARGEALLLAGQCGEALKDIEEALALDARWTRGLALRAQAYCCLGKVEQAQADEKEALTQGVPLEKPCSGKAATAGSGSASGVGR